MESLNIRLAMVVNKGRKIKEINKHLEFSNWEEFKQYKEEFYSSVLDKEGWKRYHPSMNQCHKGDLVLTPFFIRE